jgi:hypothetical protein
MDSSSSSMSSLPASLPACLSRGQHSIQNKEEKQWIPAAPACPPFLSLFRHACQARNILFKIRKRSEWIPAPQACPPFLPLFRHACQESSILFKIRKGSNGLLLFQHVLPSSLFPTCLPSKELCSKRETIPSISSTCPPLLHIFPRACQVKNNELLLLSPPACPTFLPLFPRA